MAVLARWSSWGALQQVFDDPAWAPVRHRLEQLAGPAGYAAAQRTVLNAHYTHPALARAMWKGLGQLGFAGGWVLEPGCGSGLFLATAPPHAQVTGVELDPSTALIAAALHPGHTIRGESFADTPRLGPFDAVIGNVPFARVVLRDPHHNRAGFSLHNHFLVKSLDLLRPGGVLLALTSPFTMDARSTAAREAIAARADLLTAVRLPTGTHQAMAGTEAVTDLLVLVRHDRDTPDPAAPWLATTPLHQAWPTLRPDQPPLAELPVRVNRWWAAHPELVLGTADLDHGMHGATTVAVHNPAAADPERLAEALGAALASAITASPLRYSPAPPPRRGALGPRPPADPPGVGASAGLWTGHLTQHEGAVWSAGEGAWELVKVPRSQVGELHQLLDLRDAAVALVDRESATRGHDADLEALRARVATMWRRYVAARGPLNRAVESVRTDPDGQTTVRRTPPAVLRLFARDPHAALVLALEDADRTTGAARPAAILSRRVSHAPAPPPRTTDPAAALASALNSVGRLDLDLIAGLLAEPPEQAAARLRAAGLVFTDPDAPPRLVTAAEYLSGDVRAKLRAARTAAAADPTLAVNVAALVAVQPTELGIDEIEVRLGASWIPPDLHEQFLRELLDDRWIHVSNPIGAKWEVRGGTWGVPATHTWGTPRVPAGKLAEMLMTQRPLVVRDTLPEGREVLNPDETAALADKADLLTEQFGEWLWADPARATAMLARYNDLFNGLRLRDFATEAAALELPGLAEAFTPRPHQREVVARMISSPSVGIFQVVGAGKTAAIAMGVHELRRLGMVTKPAVVVPNHMLGQFQREWLQLYPHARLLTASSEDLAPRARPAFIARAATHDWDAVILTHTAFGALPVRPATEAAFIAEQIAEMRAALAASQDDPAARRTRKAIERKVLAAEERRKKLADKRVDPGLTFEATGIDYLVVDEVHLFKNLVTESAIPDLAIPGSARAFDLHMKLWQLRQAGQPRVCALATGTPIANSITEAHVMLRYLSPELLAATGTTHFDKWCATFAKSATRLEVAPEGGYRAKTRTSHFHNVPELSLMLSTVADVRLAADLDLPIPAHAPGPAGTRGPQIVEVPPTPELTEFMAGISRRADAVRAKTVPPDEDNLLKISSDGRAAALDVRLVRPGVTPSGPTKLDVAAERIADLHHANAGRTYLDERGEPSPIPGALQLVFCDQGTPGSTRTDLYALLRDALAERGVPRGQVRFVHDAATDAAKATLFAEARAGAVSVLIGSTEKMGTGMNVQARLLALHHLDPPWRPADMEQREGRILRQGNQNPEVHVLTYSGAGSFDAFSYQALERKAGFVRTLLSRTPGVRSIEDAGESQVLSYAEVKAIALGDPLALELATAEQDLARLTRQLRAHQRSQTALRQIAAHTRDTLTQLTADRPAVVAAAARTTPTTADRFEATIAGHRYSDRAAAGEALWAQITPLPRYLPPGQRAERGVVCQLAGHPLAAHLSQAVDGLVLTIRADVPHAPAHQVLLAAQPGQGLRIVRAGERAAAAIAALPASLDEQIDEATRTLAAAERDLGAPFRHADQLTATTARVSALTAALSPPDPLTAEAEAAAAEAPLPRAR